MEDFVMDNIEIPKPTKKDLLRRRMVESIIGAFDIGYELGKSDEEEKKD